MHGCPRKDSLARKCPECEFTDCPHRPDDEEECDWYHDDPGMCCECPKQCPYSYGPKTDGGDKSI